MGTPDTLEDALKQIAGYESRLSKMASHRKDAEARATEAQAALDEAQLQVATHERAAIGFDAVLAELDSHKGQAESWAVERSILSAGITEGEGLDFTLLAWQRIAEDARPAGGVAEWLASRDTLPKAVQAYLPAEAQEAATAPATPQPTVNDNDAARPFNGTPSPYSGGAIAGLSAAGKWRDARAAAYEAAGLVPPALPSKG